MGVEHPASLVIKPTQPCRDPGCSHFGHHVHSSFKGISRISISVAEAKAEKQRGQGSHWRPCSKLRTELGESRGGPAILLSSPPVSRLSFLQKPHWKPPSGAFLARESSKV